MSKKSVKTASSRRSCSKPKTVSLWNAAREEDRGGTIQLFGVTWKDRSVRTLETLTQEAGGNRRRRTEISVPRPPWQRCDVERPKRYEYGTTMLRDRKQCKCGMESVPTEDICSTTVFLTSPRNECNGSRGGRQKSKAQPQQRHWDSATAVTMHARRFGDSQMKVRCRRTGCHTIAEGNNSEQFATAKSVFNSGIGSC